MKLSKERGQDLAHQLTTFPDFFRNWIYLVKKGDACETTFQNYERALSVVEDLLKDIKLKDLNDIIVQQKMDEYGETRSQKTVHEVLLKIKNSLRDAHSRGYITNDFTLLVKARGKKLNKRNKALSINDMKKLRNYVLENSEDEFNVLILTALETGMRRGELLGIRPEYLHEIQPIKGTQYEIAVRESISPTSSGTEL